MHTIKSLYSFKAVDGPNIRYAYIVPIDTYANYAYTYTYTYSSVVSVVVGR